METGVGFGFAQIEKEFGLGGAGSDSYSPLALAYLGDSVYELVIRSLVVGRGNRQVKKLHQETISLVQACAQSEMMRALQPLLTEEEHAVYRRGRNTSTVSPARHQSITDYRRATGFEALMGWLYLRQDWERILELIRAGLAHLEDCGAAAAAEEREQEQNDTRQEER